MAIPKRTSFRGAVQRRARNPYLRGLCSWIPDSLTPLGLRDDSRGRTLEEGDKEAVGAVLRGCEAEIVGAGGRGAADRLGPGPCDRVRREIAMRVEESFGLRLVLLAQQGAGRIDQAAAGFHEARRAVEDRALALDQLGKVLRRAAPFGIGVHPEIALARQHAALDIADAGAAQPLPGALEAPFRGVAGDELAAVPHRSRQCQRLAAGAGAEIDDTHAGARAGEKGGDLRRLVLHLDEALLEGSGTGERHAMRDAQPERRPAGRLGPA